MRTVHHQEFTGRNTRLAWFWMQKCGTVTKMNKNSTGGEELQTHMTP